jgi:hypothetical protein
VQLPEPATLQGRERDGGEGADRGRDPERQRRAFPAADAGHDGGGRREQRDHHCSVTGRSGRQGIGGQEREADHDPAGDDGQPRPLDDRRQVLPGHGEHGGGQHRGDDRPPRADEQRGQPADGDPGEGDGEGERRHAEQSPSEAGARRR